MIQIIRQIFENFRKNILEKNWYPQRSQSAKQSLTDFPFWKYLSRIPISSQERGLFPKSRRFFPGKNLIPTLYTPLYGKPSLDFACKNEMKISWRQRQWKQIQVAKTLENQHFWRIFTKALLSLWNIGDEVSNNFHHFKREEEWMFLVEVWQGALI